MNAPCVALAPRPAPERRASRTSCAAARASHTPTRSASPSPSRSHDRPASARHARDPRDQATPGGQQPSARASLIGEGGLRRRTHEDKDPLCREEATQAAPPSDLAYASVKVAR